MFVFTSGNGSMDRGPREKRRRDRRKDRRRDRGGGGEPRAKHRDSHLKGQVLFKDAANLTASYFNTV